MKKLQVMHWMMTIWIALTVLFSIVILPVVAQESTDEPMATETMTASDPVSGTGTETDGSVPPVGVVNVGELNINTLIIGGMLVVTMAILGLLGMAWIGIQGTKQSVTPDAVQAIIMSSFGGVSELWTKLGTEVRATPNPYDDAAYFLANIPVEAIRKHLDELGLVVMNKDSLGRAGHPPSNSSPTS